MSSESSSQPLGNIYIFTNKHDNKMYIGQTRRELDTRIKDHMKLNRR